MFDEECEQYWAESKLLPIKAILDYWCEEYDDECREAKKYAIISACDRGEIKYERNDGKDFPDPPLQLYSRGILLINRESFEIWAKQFNDDDNKPDLPLDRRSKTTYLNIIGALLEVTIGEFKNEQFQNQSKLINFLIEKYKNIYGISERTLGDKFPLAKRTFNDAKLDQ